MRPHTTAGLVTPTPRPAGLTITAYGRPIPQGSKRHVGRGILVEQTNVKPWREAIKTAAVDPDRPRIDALVRVTYVFAFDRPTGHFRSDGTLKESAPMWPGTRANGDLEKLVRAANDALTDAAVWRDDSQVVAILAEKVWAGEAHPALRIPGAHIIVELARWT